MRLEQRHNFLDIDSQRHSRESLFANRENVVRLAGNYMALLGQNPAKIFSSIGNADFWDPEYLDESGREWGMHIMDSLRCLVDFERTHSLLAGIKKTVEAMKQEGRRDIIGIDAGTGSGILAMGLIAAGCSKVYALEINPETVNASRRFIKECGFEDEIEVIECDATKVDISGIKNVGILVSENLSTGLFDEPQYQIIANLSKHLAPDVKIVPFNCTLYAALGWASWKDVGKEGFTIAAEKLRDRVRVSNRHPYIEITSKRSPEIPRISGTAEIPILDNSYPINTLYISTRFQMNDGHGGSVVLNPDDAEFLGKTCAFRLPQGMQISENVINFQADYPAGYPKKFSTIRIKGNLITLESSNVQR